jgi:UDP-apiose/xylose synthase
VNIALLGAGGFLGSHLIEHLVERGEHTVVGLDVTDEKLSEIDRSTFVFHNADIRTADSLLDEIVREADLVVDLVAHANPSLYVAEPLEVFDLNFTHNLKIVDLCVNHGKRLVQFSSAEVYGKAAGAEPCNEETTDFVVGPVHKERWIYSTAKALLERVIYAHGSAGNLEFTIIRPFNIIGKRLDYLVPAGSMGGPRVFAHYMSALLTGGPMYLVDGGYCHRAFTHVRDACGAFQALLDNPEGSRNQIYNLGNPQNNVTIREFAKLMREAYQDLTGMAPKSDLVEVSADRFYGPGYEDADRLPPDIRALSRLGWQPRYDLPTTLRDAMSHYLDSADVGSLVSADVGSLVA